MVLIATHKVVRTITRDCGHNAFGMVPSSQHLKRNEDDNDNHFLLLFSMREAKPLYSSLRMPGLANPEARLRTSLQGSRVTKCRTGQPE